MWITILVHTLKTIKAPEFLGWGLESQEEFACEINQKVEDHDLISKLC